MKNQTQKEYEMIQFISQNDHEVNPVMEKMTDEIWQAIIMNNSSYDDQFL